LDRSELTLAISAGLVGALLLGWILHWMFARLGQSAAPRNARRASDLAHRLHAAEEAQHRAESRLREIEHDLRARAVDLQAELDATAATLERERAASEELRAAYRATMTERAASPT